MYISVWLPNAFPFILTSVITGILVSECHHNVSHDRSRTVDNSYPFVFGDWVQYIIPLSLAPFRLDQARLAHACIAASKTNLIIFSSNSNCRMIERVPPLSISVVYGLLFVLLLVPASLLSCFDLANCWNRFVMLSYSCYRLWALGSAAFILLLRRLTTGIHDISGRSSRKFARENGHNEMSMERGAWGNSYKMHRQIL